MQFFVSAGKLSPSLAKVINAGQEEIEVMVIFNDDDIRREASRQRKDLGLKSNNQSILAEKRDKYHSRKQLVLSRLDMSDYTFETDYENLPIVHMMINKKALDRLLSMGEVASVQENGVTYMSLAQSLPLINAPDTHDNGYTGSGTSVAVLDTGVDYTHADFGSCTSPGVPASCKVAHVQDFAPNDGALDADGHGTNVSGVVVGVAPDTKIIGLDVFNGLSASYTDIVNAINWVIGDTTYNIVAVNLSLGGTFKYTAECPTHTLAVAITSLKAAGITTAASSGNEKYLDGLSTPACAPDGISVGAVYDADIGSISYTTPCVDSTTAADQVTCFSNTATFLKMLAPGAYTTAAGSTYAGTSQAAPHVAGAIAVLKESAPGLSVDEITTRLTGTGVPVTDTRPTTPIVKPRLNLFNAVFSVPLIGFTPTSLSFNEIQNGTLASSQDLTIRNDGGDILLWSVTGDQSWLDLTPAGGTDDGIVTVSVNTSSMAPGTYSANITISGNAGNSPKTIPVSLTVFDPAYAEDFETGNLNNLPWETTGNAAWNVQGTTVYGGSYSAESGIINDGEGSTLRVSLNLTESGYVYFQLKTSTEPQWDKLIFTVDNSTSYGKWDGWHGETDWTQVVSTLEVPAGTHVFSWEYEKDASVSEGSDKVWLDDIVFPAFNEDVQNIEISPTSHSFGNEAVGGNSSAQSFTVTNTNSGTNNLAIDTVSIFGDDSSHFFIQSDTCSSQTIAPSAGCVVDVVFSPSSAGAKSVDLRIISDDPDTQVLDVALDGTGLDPYTLTVIKSGSGDGSVTSSPVGIDCGVDCSETYLDGEIVTLSAAADAESGFGGWSGGGCSGTGDCVLTITALTEVTASFSKDAPVAAFNGSPVSGNAPLIVDFSDSSTNSPTSWLWDFGDIETSIDQNPTHVYQAAGTYTVSLTATNAGGSDDEIKAGYIVTGLCTNQPVRVGGTYYDTIQESFDNTPDGETITIQTHIANFSEDLLFNKDIAVTFTQGYNCEYIAQAPGATLDGSLTISAGSVVVENLTIQ